MFSILGQLKSMKGSLQTSGSFILRHAVIHYPLNMSLIQKYSQPTLHNAHVMILRHCAQGEIQSRFKRVSPQARMLRNTN